MNDVHIYDDNNENGSVEEESRRRSRRKMRWHLKRVDRVKLVSFVSI